MIETIQEHSDEKKQKSMFTHYDITIYHHRFNSLFKLQSKYIYISVGMYKQLQLQKCSLRCYQVYQNVWINSVGKYLARGSVDCKQQLVKKVFYFGDNESRDLVKAVSSVKTTPIWINRVSREWCEEEHGVQYAYMTSYQQQD